MPKTYKILIILALAFALCVAIFIALGIGEIVIKFRDCVRFIFAPDESYESNLINAIRLPRIIAALAVGVALALSGSLYQGIIGNPLVSPSILGVLNGASFGAALGMILGFSMLGIEILSFAFGIGALFLLVCDTLARSVAMKEILLGIVTATLGIPIFVVILIFNKSAKNI